LLNQLIAQTGERAPVNLRLNLAQILLAENNIEEARPQIDLIAKELPADDPQLIRLRIQVLDKEKDKAERQKLFAQLPQGDRQQTLEKARFAMVEMREEELGLGLLEALRASDPADPVVVQALANHYLTKQQKDKAQQIIDEALAKAPDNVGLQMAKRQLAAETPEQMQALQEQAVQNITDPFRKEIQLFNLALRDNNLEQARAHLANAEKMKPEDRTLLELVYQFNLSQKDFDKAGQYLDRLAKVDPGSVEIHRVRFAVAKGDLNRALELATQLVRDRGEFAVSHITLADVQRARNSLVEAANSYKAALERDTRNFEAMRGLIDVYYSLSQPNEAKRYIDVARRVFPNNPQIKEWELGHEVQFGNPEVAIEPRKQQLEQDKENPTNWLALGQVYSAAGRNKQDAGKDEEAKAFFAKAKETLDAAYAKWPDDPRLAMAVAQISIPLQKTEEGEKALRALIARPAMQGKPEPTIALAEFQVYAGRPAEGEKTLRGLFEQNKQDLSLQLRLLELIMRDNRIDEAIELLKVNGDHAMIRQVRIETLVRSGRIEEAQKELDAVLTSSPPSAGLHYLQGLIHKASSRLSEAIASFDKTIQMEPRMAWAMYQRGVVRGMRGDVDGAIQDLANARDLMPQLSDARIKLADMYRAHNDPSAAVRELEAGVRANPADRSLRLALVEQYRQQVQPRWSEAERVFREAKNIPTLARDAALLQAEARMWSDRNDPQRAVACIKEAAEVAPHDLSITRTFFDVLLKAKAYRDVLAASDRMLKANQHQWWIYQARGTAKARNNDKDGAVAEYEAGLKYATEQRDDSAAMALIRTMAQEVGFAAAMNRVEPKAQNDNSWRIVAMQLCRSQGDFNGALRWGQMLLNDASFSGNQRESVMFALGEIHVHLGQFDKAVELYKQLAESHPDDPSVLNNLAAVMTMPNSPSRPEDALPYSQKAYDLMRRSGNAAPEVLDTHGWILVMIGRVDDGILLLQEALDRKQFPDAYYHLGDAYLRQSKPVEAERALRQAQEMIARAEREKQAVDPTLSRRVEEALIRASALMQQKSQAGTNN
jgi:tetratricopeptide (TPR) repeat protein